MFALCIINIVHFTLAYILYYQLKKHSQNIQTNSDDFN